MLGSQRPTLPIAGEEITSMSWVSRLSIAELGCVYYRLQKECYCVNNNAQAHSKELQLATELNQFPEYSPFVFVLSMSPTPQQAAIVQHLVKEGS